ncbi:MAG: hypothetical protein ABI867_28400 [Kofleriaceae bacterium]
MRRWLVLLVACGSPAPSSETRPVEQRPPELRPVPAPAFAVAAPRDRIVGLGRGATHACVVRESGGVDCWGQLGFGRPEPAPRRIPGVNDAIAISQDARCVVRKTGDVACLAGDRVELEPAGIANVATIGTGAAGCFTLRDGSATCGGRRIPNVSDARAITQGNSTACVVRATGDVVCGASDGNKPMAAFTPVVGLERVRRFAIADSYRETRACAILESGPLRCFRLRGLVIEELDRTEPTFDPQVFAGATELAFIAGQLEAIAGGKVVRWSGTTSERLASLDDAVQLVPGCALRAHGSVACWGSNAGGVLGQPTTIGRSRRPPATVVGLADVATIALGSRDSWALTRGGRVFHWGAHAGGWATEVATTGLPRITTIAATSHGSACVLAGDSSTWCWRPDAPAFATLHAGGVTAIAGEDTTMLVLHRDAPPTRTQLDPTRDHAEPEQPPVAPAGVTALASGKWRACAIEADHHVSCMDKTWYRIDGIERATQVVVASIYGCALAGGVSCWMFKITEPGANPKSIPSLGAVTDLAMAPDRICGVRDGKVVCVPINGTAPPYEVIAANAVDVELGDDDAGDPRGSEARQRDGGAFGCAIMRDRTVQCWGTNDGGELGDGSIHAWPSPLGVPGL